ncbi:MAG: glycosyltransferase [Bacteroidota bacterium]
MSNPLVSVIVLVYNHENFIEDCLHSILKQSHSNIEVVVFDDQSSDRSWSIIESFRIKDPRIIAQRNDENVGPARNFEKALNSSRGEFIAICEGDDFWTNERKLEFQVEAIRRVSSVSLVYADYSKSDESGKITRSSVLDAQPLFFKLENMIEEHGPATNSVMMRKSAFPESLPHEFFEVLNPDVFIIGYGLAQGETDFIDQVLSSHREQEKGIWTSLEKIEQRLHRYLTLLKFFRVVGRKDLESKALNLFERQVIQAKEIGSTHFETFFSELPFSKRLLLKLKWLYSGFKNS